MTSSTYIKSMNYLAAIPVICCIITFGYLQYQVHQLSTRISDDTHLAQISVNVADNRMFSEANSKKIDALHDKVIEETINKFRSDDMQAWIKHFKEENPDLHIPDFILDTQ